MKRLIICLLLSCMIVGSAAFACGVCVDDKVASAYDHAVVQDAWKNGKVVVFCELSGPYPVKELNQKAKAAAKELRGVSQASIRTGKDLAVVSFMLDVSAQPPTAAINELGQRLQKDEISPELLKVLESKPKNRT